MSDSTEIPDPFARFHESIARARSSEVFDADRAALATADAEGCPSVRFVLVREVGDDGFAFFTNYESDKARELAVNPHAALVWDWHTIGEQVRARGRVERLSPQRSDAYFATRPRDSRVGAWASPQSRPIGSREELDANVAEAARRVEGREDIERPPHWGGYLLVPDRIEFWINGGARLHDRFAYTRAGDGWTVQRLAP